MRAFATGGGVAIGGNVHGGVIITGSSKIVEERAFPYESVFRVDDENGRFLCLGFLCRSGKETVGVVPNIGLENPQFITFPFFPDYFYSGGWRESKRNLGVGVIHFRSVPLLSRPAHILPINQPRFVFFACGYIEGVGYKFISGFATEKKGMFVLEAEVPPTEEQWHGFIGSPVWDYDEQGVAGIITKVKDGTVYMVGVAEILMVLGVA